MEEYGLTRQKLFTLKRGTLEKRLRTYYYETKNEKATIEMLIALQVRDELTSEADNFSHMLRSVVSRIFLHRRTTKAMRRFYRYFTEYFSEKDWQSLVTKLFPVLTYNEETAEEFVSKTSGEDILGVAES
ncbi:hypothetical protein EGCR1_05855 [Enterococcus gilvus]|jgi:thiaminase|uniref:hypothetical protein n=1 Tax=Enterococcus gilvus TaxID=160453 RepID=UPI000DF60D17|nr:hypothetical protein [Enterococcus gilvus]AXG38261.1 hypothetical protein EGCR1_05855 [Enterococcus gilvus]